MEGKETPKLILGTHVSWFAAGNVRLEATNIDSIRPKHLSKGLKFPVPELIWYTS